MFLTLLGVTLLISVGVSFLVVRVFRRPIDKILKRIIADEISEAWVTYITFGLYVVGISSGVRIYELERYVTEAPIRNAEVLALTRDRWILEVYRTIISGLEGLAAVLLAVAVALLVAFAPQERQPFRLVGAASVLVVVSWVAASALFGFYATNLASYGSIFGGIAFVIILLTYVFLSAIVFLVGVSLDAFLRSLARSR